MAERDEAACCPTIEEADSSSNHVSEDEKIVTGSELRDWLRISSATQWRWTKLGILPAPFRLHPNGPNLYRKRVIRELIDSAPIVDIYRNCGNHSKKRRLRDE